MNHMKAGLAGLWLSAWPTLAAAQAAGGGGNPIVSLIVPMALIIGIVWLIVRRLRGGSKKGTGRPVGKMNFATKFQDDDEKK